VSAYEWMDETHDSVDAFIAAVRREPTEAQLKALGIYSTRRTGARVERRLADDLRATAKPLPDRRKGLRWAWNANVLLTAVALVGLWLALRGAL